MVSERYPTGWFSLTVNGTPPGWARASGAASVTPVPSGPAVPTVTMWPYSMSAPVPTKIGWPAARFPTADTFTVVAPGTAGAASVVMPGCGVPLPSWNVVWLPAYPTMGVALVASGPSAVMLAPGEPGPVSGYAWLGPVGVAATLVDHGPTPPPVTLFQKNSVPRWNAG